MPSDRWVWILRFDESLVTGESPVTGADVGGLARSAHRLGFDNPTCRTVFAEADQIEMSERRHGAALDQAHAGGFCRPARVPHERKLRTPAEFARGGLEPVLERAPQAGLGADATDQDDFAARL